MDIAVHLIHGLLANRVSRITGDIGDLAHLLLETGWVVGRKRGGTRWVYEAAVSRDAGMRQLARKAVEELCARPEDGWYLVWAALDSVDLEGPNRVVGSPYLPTPKGAAARALRESGSR